MMLAKHIISRRLIPCAGFSSTFSEDAFRTWTARKGIIVSPKVRVHSFGPDNRGLLALAEFTKGEPLLRAPRSAILLLDDVAPSAQGYTEFACAFAAFFLSGTTEWKTYVDSFPSTVNSFPAFFGPRERAMLGGTVVMDSVKQQEQRVAEDYAKFCAGAAKHPAGSFQDFLKLAVLVKSRCFNVLESRLNGIPTMVPFADMLNHSPAAKASWFYSTKMGEFRVEADERIKPGEEVCINYGADKPNSIFLSVYGFVPAGNHVNDEIPFDLTGGLDIVTSDILRQKIKLTAKPSECDAYLMSYLRVVDSLNAKAGESSAHLLEDYELSDHKIPPVSRENEAQALRRLKSFCESRLARFPSSPLDEDVCAEGRDRSLLAYVNGERLLYKRYQQFAETGLRGLETGEIVDGEKDTKKFAKYFAGLQFLLKSKR